MCSYLTRLECLIEKWQSRRKTIEISQHQASKESISLRVANKAGKSFKSNVIDERSREKRAKTRPISTGKLGSGRGGSDKENNTMNKMNGKINQMKPQSVELRGDDLGEDGEELWGLKVSAVQEKINWRPSLKHHNNLASNLRLVNESDTQKSKQKHDHYNSNNQYHHQQQQQQQQQQRKHHQRPSNEASSVAGCGRERWATGLYGVNLLHIIAISLLLTLTNCCYQHQVSLAAAHDNNSDATASAAAVSSIITASNSDSGSKLATNHASLAGQTISNSNKKSLIASLAHQMAGSLGSRDRWLHVPSPQAIRNHNSNTRRRELITRALGNLRNRIGARNTIRVHNAFRDFAWRLLARLSMPTPVIYELRRQNFYSPEEDVINDRLYNKNTTRTIRTKRQLAHLAASSLLPSIRSGAPFFRPSSSLINATTKQRGLQRIEGRNSRDDDDEDEPDGLRDRIRLRLEDLVNLSRRSLFGRVVRIPSIFPFRRQEGDKSITTNPAKEPQTANRKRQRRRNRFKRKRKDADRQMISINGKQYYVDDDGELKEVKEHQQGGRRR